MIIVQKYGGKSVATIERIRDVAAQIVKRHVEGIGLVIVVSAMADTTDTLLEHAHSISNCPSEREVDMLLTAGERISMALLSMAICDLGHSAISFTGSQSGIITDDVHTRARIVEIRASRIIDELQKGKIVIVAGFQGVSGRREVTTLGRGGSDTTAIGLAYAIGAERCEIYSDVDGLYSADPKDFPDADFIPETDYEILFDLTFFGAQVVHSRAVELARKHDIPLMLASSIKKEKNTMITSKAIEGANFTAVSSHKKVLWAQLHMPNSVFPNLLDKLDSLRTGIRTPNVFVENGITGFSFWVLPDQANEIIELLNGFDSIDYSTERLSILALAGYSVADSAEAMATVAKVLDNAEIPFSYIGTTNRSTIIALRPEYRQKAEETIFLHLVKKNASI